MLSDIAAYLQIDPTWPQAPFWAAWAVIAGALIGELGRQAFALPRIVGYSIVGLVIGAFGLGSGGALHGAPRLVVDLALALLLFELGSRVRLGWLRANPGLLLTSAAETLLAFAAVFYALRAIGLAPLVALACATIASCASGAVIARVASELKSAGQVTERLIVFATLNTLFAVLLFKLVIGWLHIEVAGDWVRAISQPLWAFGGSVLLAALLAALVAWVARRLDLGDENAALLLLGLVVLALMVAKLFNLSTLLVPLLAGVVLRNTTERPWVWPRHFGSAGGVLVLMMFVIVGSAWTVSAIAGGAFAALVMLGVRWAAKSLAVIVFAPWSRLRLRPALGLALALGLSPVSSTALVLLTELQDAHPSFAPAVAAVVLSAIAFTELLGPLAVQWGLSIAGERQPRARRAAAAQAGRVVA